MRQIHWFAPSLMVASLLVGTLLALGHHLFYDSLDRQRAATTLENYGILGVQVSIQQINTAVGTAFAFLVKACLMLSISIAYFQIFMWSVGNYRKKGTRLVHLDVMTSALHDLVSLLSFQTWRQRPWLWLLAVVAWYGFTFEFGISVWITNVVSRLMPIASIITPATLSVGVDFPLPTYMHVPNVDFSSLNLAAPMTSMGSRAFVPGIPEDLGFKYLYTGPSLTVRRIADAVAAQGFILPVPAPSVNSSWDLDFNGPSLHCNPVSLDLRQAILDNILNYTLVRSEGQMYGPDECASGPGYVAWHPWMAPGRDHYLPFDIDELNISSINSDRGEDDVLNHDNRHGTGLLISDLASVFLAATPHLFTSGYSMVADSFAICPGEPSYDIALAKYNKTSTVLRCDVHKSTYHTAFSFIDGVQTVDIKDVKDIIDSPMVTFEEIVAYFNSSDEKDATLQPHACPPWKIRPDLTALDEEKDGLPSPCLLDPFVLSTVSYQAVMHAFIDLIAGMISRGDREDQDGMISSTTRLESTVLALAPELAFLQPPSLPSLPSAQQRAVTWNQRPFSGLLNDAPARNSTLPLPQALEQLFQNITFSLMSAPDLQPNTSSIYLPNKTKVTSTTPESIYIYAASKLWLAYGLAVGATALIVSLGLAAMIANDASFSDQFSTIFRLSRGAQLSYEINQADRSGRKPLPAYAKRVRVRFPSEQLGERKNGDEYGPVDGEGGDDEVEVVTEAMKN